MGAAAFATMHADLIAVMGDRATYTAAAGGSAPVDALLDRHTVEVGEFGQTVSYRPSIAVLCADVPDPAPGDIITFADPVTGAVTSTWRVLRPADMDDMVARLWVEPA